MSSTYGQNLKLTIFGQSHAPAIGMTLSGIEAGQKIDPVKLQRFLDRRAPGNAAYATARKEADCPEFISGLVENTTCGAPITAIIRNQNTHSKDYENLKNIPRPGHADYTARVKYGDAHDLAGGGHFSGRLTAPLCVAGGICLQLLENLGVTVEARIVSIATVKDNSPFVKRPQDLFFAVSDETVKEKMLQTILDAKNNEDSVGGVIECRILGLPVGLGDPIFDGMENRISSIIFGIPAVKGIEFGDGFAATERFGSENNDAFTVKNNMVQTVTNHCGGILGGITNGMPLTFKVAVKPTPSIGKPQQSVDLSTLKETTLNIKGRHDPCIVPRAVAAVEAAAAIAVYDALMEERHE